MKLNNLSSFNEFKKIRKENLLLEASYDAMSNTTKFSDSLVGRGLMTLLKGLKKSKNWVKLRIYKNKYDSELAMGILRAYQEFLNIDIKQQSQAQSQSQSQEQEELFVNSNDKIKINNIEYIKQSKIFLNSILEISTMIENNAVRFKGVGERDDEDYGKDLNRITYFDFKKYQKIKNIYNRNKKNVEIFEQLLSILKQGLEAAISNKNKEEINLFEKELKIYGDKYFVMVRDSIEKNKKQTFDDISKDIINRVKTNTSSIDDVNNLLKNQKVKKIYNELIDEWKKEQKRLGKNYRPGEGTRKRIMKDTISALTESLLLEEVQSNIEENEIHSKNAFIKIIKSYKQSDIKNYLKEIENILNSSRDLSSGKDKYKESIRNIVIITKQVVKNVSISKVISFDQLIKEGLYDNDIPKSISLFAKYILAFKEDMSLLGHYGSLKLSLNNFIISFIKLEKMLNINNENFNVKRMYLINESKKNKILRGEDDLDWTYFSDESKLKKMIEDFKDKSSMEKYGFDKNLLKSSYLRKRSTELVNKNAIRVIQYSVENAIYHTKSPVSGKLFPGQGGGIDKSNETSLAKIWKEMVHNVKSKYHLFLLTDDLDPYLLNKSDSDSSGGYKNKEQESQELSGLVNNTTNNTVLISQLKSLLKMNNLNISTDPNKIPVILGKIENAEYILLYKSKEKEKEKDIYNFYLFKIETDTNTNNKQFKIYDKFISIDKEFNFKSTSLISKNLSKGFNVLNHVGAASDGVNINTLGNELKQKPIRLSSNNNTISIKDIKAVVYIVSSNVDTINKIKNLIDDKKV